MANDDNLHTISSSLPVSRQSKRETVPDRQISDLERERDKRVVALLGRLALHYYRPDFTEKQAMLLIADMLDDLRDFSIPQIETACRAWRKKPEATYFPKSGQLIGLMKESLEASIARRRALAPAYRADRMIEQQRKPLKPWRQVLAENGRLPPDEPDDAA